MEPPHRGRSGIGVSGVLCILFFIVCLGLWLVFGSFVLCAFEMALAGEADRLGMVFFSFFMLIVSMPALAVAIVLSLLARRLPMTFRILSLLPGSAGILVAVAMYLVFMAQGK